MASKRKSSPTLRVPRANLTAKEVALLEALPADLDKAPDQRIALAVQEAKDTATAFARCASDLVGATELTARSGQDLLARLDVFERAEAAWQALRAAATTSDVTSVRRDAEALKADFMAAGRYFLRADAGIQTRLDRIQEGTGDVDLADDLRKLAELVTGAASALKKAKLPKGAPARAGALADDLSAAVTSRRVDPGSKDAQSLRNRAYYYLQLAIDDIRAAGRYGYRNSQAKRALFRAIPRRMKPQKAVPAPPAPAP
jgi:hypothetical protein